MARVDRSESRHGAVGITGQAHTTTATGIIAAGITTSLVTAPERHAKRSSAARTILLVASVGQDGGETPRTLLDEEGLFPILIQYLEPLGLDPAGGLAGPGGDRMSRAGRGGSIRPEGGVGAMEEGGDLLELFGSDLVTHRRTPAWKRRSLLLTASS
jgi:hypothetical protein